MNSPMETMMMSRSVQRVIRGRKMVRSKKMPSTPTRAKAASKDPTQPIRPGSQAMTNTAT